jgi:hypothetical protein
MTREIESKPLPGFLGVALFLLLIALSIWVIVPT